MAKKLPEHNYAVIMAGGSGTRLWPLSRRNLPKQMQKFVSDKTLIDETVERLVTFVAKDNIYVSTTGNYAAQIKELLPDIPAKHIIVEPVARGTTAAFALVTSTIVKRDPDAIIFTIASDHTVTDVAEFQKTLLNTFNYVNDYPKDIALVGIRPTRPDTALGYIKLREQIKKSPIVYTVDKFVEKPSYEVAKKYADSGEYFWNAAYYCFKAKTLLRAYRDADPKITDSIDAYLSTGNIEDFMQAPDKVHEIEVINPAQYRLVVVPGEFSWSDIGNWQALHEVLSKLEGKNLVTHGSRHIDVNSTNCLIFSNSEKLVATVGLENIVVVNTPDVLLVMNKEQPQEIKQLLDNLKASGMTEYL